MRREILLLMAFALPQAPPIIDDLGAKPVSECCGGDCQCCGKCPCREGYSNSSKNSNSSPSTTIVFYTRPSCPPCEKFKKECVPSLQAKGWTVIERESPWVATPLFKYGKDTLIGYKTRGEFYEWLTEAIESQPAG